MRQAMGDTPTVAFDSVLRFFVLRFLGSLVDRSGRISDGSTTVGETALCVDSRNSRGSVNARGKAWGISCEDFGNSSEGNHDECPMCRSFAISSRSSASRKWAPLSRRVEWIGGDRGGNICLVWAVTWLANVSVPSPASSGEENSSDV